MKQVVKPIPDNQSWRPRAAVPLEEDFQRNGQFPGRMGGRMQTKMRYCANCGYITPHCVVNKDGIEAILCENCILRWASQRDVEQKRKEEVKVNQHT